jgi:hypothetical protein
MGEDNLNIELAKVLGKVMQNSYKKKEMSEIINRILNKLEKKTFEECDETEIRTLRMEFEEIRKGFYEL